MAAKTTRTLAIAALLAGSVLGTASAQNQQHNSEYQVTTLNPNALQLDKPEWPDLNQFTSAAIADKVKPTSAARISLQRMVEISALEEFVGSDGRLAIWAARQTRHPVAIVIEGGYATPATVAQQIGGREFSHQGDGNYIARVPLVVAQDAFFHVDGRIQELRLSQQGGAFFVNDGLTILQDTRLTAWNETRAKPAAFVAASEFRPFLVSWGGAELYIADSQITSLGYSASKSYGITISQYSPSTQAKLQRPAPRGWIVNSEIRDNWFGFYCYEAEDLAIVGNVFENNIVYGIDPHDRSSGLVIAGNEVTGTRKKHGIIISREVNDSWILRNKSSGNALAGIMIDRQSQRNVVAENAAYENGSDGIVVYESPDNLFWKNEVVANATHGIRVRNSVNVKLYHNRVIANGFSGIYGHVRDLSTTDRDAERDPFTTDVSLVVVGGELIHNGSGPIAIDQPLSMELFDVRMLAPNNSMGISLRGILHKHQHRILDLLVRQRKAVMLAPAGQAAPQGHEEEQV